MGCAESKPQTPPREKKEYTFGRDPSLDPADFRARGLEAGAVFVRRPGSVRGQQFVIEDCTGAEIYVLDHSAAVQVDACVGCRIVIGPCESSVFLRDCRGCSVVLAAQQLRTRECHDCQMLLYCATQPIIESSSGLRLGCYMPHLYPELRAQFAAAKLLPWTNRWADVHDFTPEPGTDHWTWLPDARTAPHQLSPPINEPPTTVLEGVTTTLDDVQLSLSEQPAEEGQGDEAAAGAVEAAAAGAEWVGAPALAPKPAAASTAASIAAVAVRSAVGSETEGEPWVVPHTTGVRPELAALACCFVCFTHAQAELGDGGERLVSDLAAGAADGAGGQAEGGGKVHLVRTRGFQLSTDQASELAHFMPPGQKLGSGACTGLEFRGSAGVIAQVTSAIARLELPPDSLSCPADAATAHKCTRLFFETWEVEI